MFLTCGPQFSNSTGKFGPYFRNFYSPPSGNNADIGGVFKKKKYINLTNYSDSGQSLEQLKQLL